MKKLLLVAAVLVVAATATTQTTTLDKRFIGLDTAFARVLKDWKASGFAVAVIEKNKVVYSKGFGYRDFEKKIPVTPQTLFAIGSCTKAFTSSLIGMLQKDGKLDIDKPVRDYLPDLRFYNDQMNNQITLRDMMSHRTGLPRHDFSWYFFPTTRDSLLHRIRYQEPTAGLREIWQYNNFMFLAQGVVAEKLYQRSWEQLIKEKILDKLGMNQTVFSVKDMQKSADAAKGYYVKNDSIITLMDYYNIDAMGPAGSINSNVTDMANWVITWINGGKFNGKEIIPAEHVTQAMSSQMISAAALPDKENPDIHMGTYGFGWMMSSYRGHYRVQHGGNIDGFSANVTFFPSDSIGIVVLANQNGSTVPGVVRNILSDRVLKLAYTDWNTKLKTANDKAMAAARESAKNVSSRQKFNTKPSHSLKDYAGYFTNDGYGGWDCFLKNDSLFARFPNKLIWLKHYHYDVFEPYDVDPKTGIDTSDHSQTFFQFNSNIVGEIDNVTIDLQPGLKPIQFNRTARAATVTRADLEKYVGDYELTPQVTAKVYIKNENVLFVMVPGQPEYETVPVGNHEFKLKILNGYSVKFDVTEKNEVTGLTFIQPNGNFKAKRK